MVKKIRLLGVDTPELNKLSEMEAAIKAKAYVKNKIELKKVIVRGNREDAFGRLLVEVWTPSETKSINEQLLELSLAKPFH